MEDDAFCGKPLKMSGTDIDREKLPPGNKCAYLGCGKICRQDSNIHQYRFPKDEVRCQRWVINSVAVWAAGLVASLGVAVLGVFCFLSVLQLAMISSKEKMVMKYSVVVITKVGLGLLSALLATAAASLFGLQIDDRENNGYEIVRGPAFYIQIILIILNSALFVMSLYDMFFARREGGDPTTVSVPVNPTTYGNSAFRDQRTNGGGISMTDASGKPYTSASNGSMASMNTTSTIAGSTNGSTLGTSITRSPLRSSLKKPKAGLGIQNPGFSGTSPTMSRNGSVKKVRIQTHSTEV